MFNFKLNFGLFRERYHELLEANDSIEQMKTSVDGLIELLSNLSATVQNAKDSDAENESYILGSSYFNALPGKILLDLPLKVQLIRI